MSKSYAILPCNGLDKCAGCVAREVALRLIEETGSEIICPVFYRVAEARYSNLTQEKPLLVIDGCASRCASKLAAQKGLKISEKLNISDEAKTNDVKLGTSLRLDEQELAMVERIIERLTEDQQPDTERTKAGIFFPETLSYEVYKKDKFVFRLPTADGFYFNENDVWVYVSGDKARIGVTDFVQKSLSDIMFFSPPTVGAEISQFEEAGSLESGKAVFEIVCPVSGTITAVNEALINAPEMLNQNPYEQGWIAEIDLSNFESDRELLHTFEGYFPVLKEKVDHFKI